MGRGDLVSEARRLRILIVTPSLPYPPIWGFGMRVYQLLRLLSARHHVSLLTYATPDDAGRVAALAEVCGAVHTVPSFQPEVGNSRRAQLASLVSPISYQRWRLRSRAMQTAIDRLLVRERFDVVQVESSQMAGFRFGTGVLARRPTRPLVLLDEHNIEYELLHRMYREERSLERRVYNWIEYLKVRREEHRAWDEADGCILTSAREAAILRGRRPDKPAVVAPNGVDVDHFRPDAAPSDPASIVFTGLMRYRPNVDAAIYFAQDVLPLIRRVRPEVTFTIVGADATEEVQRLAGPEVVVTGTVPDVRPYVARAAAVVVPLRMGSGTRLKVLEGLAMGKALVSTSLGCEGIDVRDGEHLLVADDPLDFAAAVLRLVDAPGGAAVLGRRGRALAVAQYSWASVGERLEGFYTEMLSRAESRRAPDRSGAPAVAQARRMRRGHSHG